MIDMDDVARKMVGLVFDQITALGLTLTATITQDAKNGKNDKADKRTVTFRISDLTAQLGQENPRA